MCHNRRSATQSPGVLRDAAAFLILLAIFSQTARAAGNPFDRVFATFMGTLANERIGYSMMPGGDINGDGFDDYLMGTFHYNLNGWDRGAVYVGLGKAISPGMNVSMDQVEARFVGTNERDGVGYSLGSGDVNGDGYNDILIGAPDGTHTTGYVYLIFGKLTIDWGKNADITQVADVRFNGNELTEGTGYSVAVVDDMNGDGCDEILIGIFHTPTATLRGKVSLFKGKRTGWVKNINAHQGDIVFNTPYNNAMLGYWNEGIGDVNGDGIPDFAIGAYGKHGVYLFLGRASMNWSAQTDVNTADVYLYSDALGWSVRPAGDVNADGYDDFIMADLSYQSGAGIVYLVLGRAQFPSQMGPGSMSASFVGEHANAGAGFWISRAGDVNADGFDDFLIGSQNFTGAYVRNGKAYMIYGKSQGWTQNVPLSSITESAVGESDGNIQYGECVSYLGDINGDGGDDFAVAAPYFDRWWGENIGKMYFYQGVSLLQISGRCTYADTDIGVPNVLITSSEADQETPATSTSGTYTYDVSGGGASFQLAPSKPTGEDVRNGGVTGYDASLIAQHVTGLSRLSDAEKELADVDRDQKISLADAIHVARSMVGLSPLTGSHAGEWQFDPFLRSYANVTSSKIGENYTATILGDVDLSFDGGLQKPNPVSEDAVEWRIEQVSDGFRILLEQTGTTPVFSFDLGLDYDSAFFQEPSIVAGETGSPYHVLSHSEEGRFRVCGFSAAPAGQDNGLLILFIPQRSNAALSSPCFDLSFRVNANPEQNLELRPASQNNLPSNDFSVRCYPNPFNASTEFEVDLKQASPVQLSIYNLRGQQVQILLDDRFEAGVHRVQWDGRDMRRRNVGSGVYLCRIRTPLKESSIKLVKLD